VVSDVLPEGDGPPPGEEEEDGVHAARDSNAMANNFACDLIIVSLEVK
jgi:hypothetical protein